jgi:valyl-tRNA synthetase
MMDEYGTDALRFTLTALAVQGRDVKLSEERIEGYKHFVNKIWNASRLVLMNLEGLKDLPELPAKPQKLMHRWILSRLQRVTNEAREAIEGYHFNHYAHVLYQFVWHEYCDWYLEMIKPDFYGQDATTKITAQTIATRVLEAILVLLHPVMPFVTEEIWQKLPSAEGSIMRASFPVRDEQRVDAEAEEQMALIMEVVNGIRNIRGEMNVPPATRVEVICLVEGAAEKKLLQDHAGTISDLSRLANLCIASAGELDKPRIAASAVTHNVEVFVLLEDVLDFDSESKRLEKELAKMEKEFGFTQKKLSNEDFLKKAPADVIEGEREKGRRLGEKLDKLRHQYEKIKILGKSATIGK